MKESAARTRIINVASRLFYEQGYNSTGINQIIDEAEIARGSLYNHFPSKRDLLSAYLKNAEELWFADLEKFLSSVKDPRKKLLALFDFRIKRAMASNYGGCQFIKIGAEIPADDAAAFEMVRHQKDRLKEKIKTILEELTIKNKQGLTKPMLAETLFLLMEGATVTASNYKNPDALKEAKSIATVLLEGRN